jgi:hypothetical protein
MGWVGVNLIHLAQDRDQWWVGFYEHGKEPSGSIKYLEFLVELLKKDSALCFSLQWLSISDFLIKRKLREGTKYCTPCYKLFHSSALIRLF